MAITAKIHHGTATLEPVAETGFLTKSITFSAKRTHKETKNAASEIVGHTSKTPMLDIELKGQPVLTSGGAFEGLAVVHPGIAKTLVNFNGTNNVEIFGFDSTSTSKVVVKDTTLVIDEENDPDMTIPTTFYPSLANFSSATE